MRRVLTQLCIRILFSFRIQPVATDPVIAEGDCRSSRIHLDIYIRDASGMRVLHHLVPMGIGGIHRSRTRWSIREVIDNPDDDNQ